MEDERLTNKEFAEQDEFKVACAKADIQPTSKQASKWRNKKGLDFLFRHSDKPKNEFLNDLAKNGVVQ